MNDWLAEIVAEDFDVMPGDVFAEAGAERFYDGFFGCEAASEVGDRVLKFIAVILLSLGEEAIEEMLSMPFDALTDTVDFDNVISEAFDGAIIGLHVHHSADIGLLRQEHCRKSSVQKRCV